MLKVGVTGGIGAGKTIVCQVFETLGIPVFNADIAAKYLMAEDIHIKQNISKLLGDSAYINGEPDKQYIANKVFNNNVLLSQLNNIIHPATIAYGNEWMKAQDTEYVIKEAAIFFESGSYKDMDVMIGVSAPDELRIERVMQRPGMSRTEVLSRMDKQWPQEEKMSKCDFVITNDGVVPLIPQVLEVHTKLMVKCNN